MSSAYVPVYEPVSNDPPNEADRMIDKTMFEFMRTEIPLESDEEMQKRSVALAEVKRIFREWVKYVAIEIVHLPEEEAVDVGGNLYISGSHRLGVREPGVDIDVVCVAPRFCLREHFFTSLKDRLLSLQEVTNLSAIETAKVPIMTFDYGLINIDLSFARLNDNTVPEDVDIFDDKILRNVDTATEKSLNGPRVTDLIFHLVPNFENFLKVLRCIRKWAKVRGIYGNKLGYLGGVNCNILVAFVCQLYPKASPSSLLARFFRVYNTWKWPEPILLTQIKPNPPGEQREVWSKEQYQYVHAMPIITPAYPSMNSSVSVTPHTRNVMLAEFKRGNDVVQQIIREKGENWSRLFTPSDFFVKYNHYLCCHIIATGENEDSRSWIGFVESRLVRLPDYLQKLPLDTLHLYPVRSKTSKSSNSCCYFIGFNIDHTRLKTKEDKVIPIDRAVSDFRQNELFRYLPDLGAGLEFLTEHLPWKRLPDEVFEKLGGKACAKLMRDIREGSAAGGGGLGSAKKKRGADEMLGLKTPIKAEDPGRAGDEENPASGPEGEVAVEGGEAIDPQAEGVLATPSQATGQDGDIGTEKKNAAAGAATPLPAAPTTSKRRKATTTEGMTSLGRSVAYTSHADIETNKNIVKLFPGRLLNSESSGGQGAPGGPLIGGGRRVPVPHVSWKVIEVRL
jgi:poly(A) polymerase